MGERESLWSELKSRHVVRAALAHIVFFWLLVQVADVILPYVGVVDEPVRWAIVAGVALFPVTLLVAWFIEHPWHRYTNSRLAIDLALILGIGVMTFAWVKNNLPQVMHDRTSIVVLPFDYSEDNPMGRTVSRALALEINSLLMKSRSIDVVGYESASSSLLEGLDIAGILDTLKVEHVLSGVINAASASSIDVRLHDAAGSEIWSSQINYDLDDLNAVQERIAAEVQGRLGETGSGTSVADVAANRCPMPTDPAALERYYTARHYTESRTNSETSNRQLEEAVEIYKSLVEEYPDFAQAYSALAWTYFYQGTFDPAYRERAMELKHKFAVDAASKAIEHCPNLGEARVHLPNEADHPNGWIGAEQNWQLWLESQPDSTEATEKLTQHWRSVGRGIEALALAERNYRLNPLSTQAIKLLVFTYIDEKRFDEAELLEQRGQDLGSTVPPFAAGARKRAECGKDLECMLANLDPEFQPFLDQLRMVYTEPANAEQQEQAVDTAMQLNEMAGGQVLNWFNGASCNYDHLTPLFFRLWDRYLEMREQGWFWYWPNAWAVSCGNVWDDPRFPEILEQAELAEYYRAKSWPDPCKPEGESFTCSEAIWREKRVANGLSVPDSQGSGTQRTP